MLLATPAVRLSALVLGLCLCAPDGLAAKSRLAGTARRLDHATPLLLWLVHPGFANTRLVRDMVRTHHRWPGTSHLAVLADHTYGAPAMKPIEEALSQPSSHITRIRVSEGEPHVQTARKAIVMTDGDLRRIQQEAGFSLSDANHVLGGVNKPRCVSAVAYMLAAGRLADMPYLSFVREQMPRETPGSKRRVFAVGQWIRQIPVPTPSSPWSSLLEHGRVRLLNPIEGYDPQLLFELVDAVALF